MLRLLLRLPFALTRTSVSGSAMTRVVLKYKHNINGNTAKTMHRETWLFSVTRCSCDRVQFQVCWLNLPCATKYTVVKPHSPLGWGGSSDPLQPKLTRRWSWSTFFFFFFFLPLSARSLAPFGRAAGISAQSRGWRPTEERCQCCGGWQRNPSRTQPGWIKRSQKTVRLA